MPRVDRTNAPRGRQLAESVEWKGQVGIAAYAGVVEGVTTMRLYQRGDIDGARDLTEGRIAATHLGVERNLIGPTRPALETNATRQSRSGLPRGAQGTGSICRQR